MAMKLPILILFIISSTSVGLLGQNERYVMPTDKKQLTVVTEPPTLYKGFLKASLAYSHGFLYNYFDDSGNRVKTLGSLSAQSRMFLLSAQYGITERLEANINLPYLHSTTNMSLDYEFPLMDSIVTMQWNKKMSGISDLYFGLRYQLLKGDIVKPYITLALTFTAPTARKNPTNIIDEENYDGAPGSGEPELTFDLNFKKIFYPYSFVSTISYTNYFGGKKVLAPYEDPTEFKSGNLFMGYLGLGFHLNDWIVINNELIFSRKGENLTAGVGDGVNSQYLAYHPYLYFQVNHIRFVQSIEVPLFGKYSSANPSYILMVQYIL